MQNRSVRILAYILIGLGTYFLLDNFIAYDLSDLFWPLVLIALGLWFIFRPKMVRDGSEARVKIIGDIDLDDEWTGQGQEIWTFVGEVNVDMARLELPPGETQLRLIGFVCDLDARTAEGVGLALTSNAFVSEVKLLGDKRDTFLSSVNYSTPGYEQAERKLRVEVTCFVADIDVW